MKVELPLLLLRALIEFSKLQEPRSERTLQRSAIGGPFPKVKGGKGQNETETETEFGTQAHRIGTKVPRYL